MNFDFLQPITAYELLAIILSAISLIVPLLKRFYTCFIKRLKLSCVSYNLKAKNMIIKRK